jgi:hypothetical protein
VLETGRALVDEAGTLISSVVATKRQPDGRRGLVVDAGVNLLFTSFWYKHDVAAAQETPGVPEPTVIYGPLCMNIDVMRDSVNLPPLGVGDRLLFRNVGAYNVTQWMQFIRHHQRPKWSSPKDRLCYAALARCSFCRASRSVRWFCSPSCCTPESLQSWQWPASVVAYALGVGFLGLAPETLVLIVSYNAAFAAVALGGVWFVPSASSWLLAMAASALSTFLCAGLLPVHQRLGVPLMVVPFNATILLILLAMRQRVRDSHPKAVDLMLATPEDNLEYLRARLLRFGWSQPVRMQLPLRGTWICTQGVDGAHTHKERWRHAWDFEVLDQMARRFAATVPGPINITAFVCLFWQQQPERWCGSSPMCLTTSSGR